MFDPDPGPGTSIVECCRVAERPHALLAADGLTPYAKTSRAKGMLLYCGIRTDDPAARRRTRNGSRTSWSAKTFRR